MKAAARSPLSPDWREIASLGEQIVSASSLSEQREIIVGITSRLVRGEAYVWLHENLFHLPNISENRLFPEEPPRPGMKLAMKTRGVCMHQPRTRAGREEAPRARPGRRSRSRSRG